MSVPLRRLWLAALSLSLLVATAACGSDSSSTSNPGGGATASRLDAVTIEGTLGTAPTVTWKSGMSASKLERSTLITGDGAAIAADKSALAQIWIGNGYTKEQAYSSFDDGGAQLITSTDSIPAITEALEGATVGSRIAVTGSADEVFGSDSGNATLGIGNKDTVLVIIDVLSEVADAPSGTKSKAPSWMPALIFTDGSPSGFDFSGIPTPTGRFRKATLIAGEGIRVRKNMTVAVRYLGEVYKGTKAFDENYTTSTSTFEIGVGKVIDGWDKQVVGSTVGSRIVIEVPPKLGYGAAGNTDAGIKGTDTLYFVIDILAAG